MRNAIDFQRKFIVSQVIADKEHQIGVPNIVPPALLTKALLVDSFHLVLDFTRNGNREKTGIPSCALDVIFAFFTIFHPLDSKECISKINQ